MKLLKQINLLTEADEEVPTDSTEEPEQSIDQDSGQPKAIDSEDDEDDSEDVGSVVEQEGFQKESKEMFAFGQSRQVTVLTKTAPLGGLEVTYQYIINPKTGSWTLSACLKGQTAEDMVEFHSGEDPSSLITSLKKSERITAQQAVDNLNPPAGT